MPAARQRELTTPDLVLLSLLAERPMHGYQANAELERREVRDWAGISRPQVYYSLEKLAQLAQRNPEKMYEKLCHVTGQPQDICCLDVFRAAVAQAKNPNLPIELRLWWHWSRKRKASDACH